MNYPVVLGGFEGQSIEVQPGGFFSMPRLLVGGKPAPAGPRRGEMMLRRKDGQEVVAVWRPQLMGLDIPQLVVDGSVVNVVEPLKWYEWVWGVLPLFLLAGGVIGGAAGAVAAVINIKVFRMKFSNAAKFAITAGVGAAAVLVYMLLATLIRGAVNL